MENGLPGEQNRATLMASAFLTTIQKCDSTGAIFKRAMYFPDRECDVWLEKKDGSHVDICKVNCIDEGYKNDMTNAIVRFKDKMKIQATTQKMRNPTSKRKSAPLVAPQNDNHYFGNNDPKRHEAEKAVLQPFDNPFPPNIVKRYSTFENTLTHTKVYSENKCIRLEVQDVIQIENFLTKKTKTYHIVDFIRDKIIVGVRATDVIARHRINETETISSVRGDRLTKIDDWDKIWIKRFPVKSVELTEALCNKEKDDMEKGYSAMRTTCGKLGMEDLVDKSKFERKTCKYQVYGDIGAAEDENMRPLSALPYPPLFELPLSGIKEHRPIQDNIFECFICNHNVKMNGKLNFDRAGQDLTRGGDFIHETREQKKAGSKIKKELSSAVSSVLETHTREAGHEYSPIWYTKPWAYTNRPGRTSYTLKIHLQSLLWRAFQVQKLPLDVFTHVKEKQDEMPLKCHLSRLMGYAACLNDEWDVLVKRDFFTKWQPKNSASDDVKKKAINLAKSEVRRILKCKCNEAISIVSKSFVAFDFLALINTELKSATYAWNSLSLFFARGVFIREPCMIINPAWKDYISDESIDLMLEIQYSKYVGQG